jgi:hypothetical protein
MFIVGGLSLSVILATGGTNFVAFIFVVFYWQYIGKLIKK